MKPVEVDCAHIRAERAAGAAPQPQFPDLTAPPLPCTVRIVGNRLEGETTLDNLAEALRIVTGRFVVNKAGLSGSYRMTMDFDFRASRRGPELAATPSDVPLVYTAVQEQLGLKLEPSRATREILIVDRLERPTPN